MFYVLTTEERATWRVQLMVCFPAISCQDWIEFTGQPVPFLALRGKAPAKCCRYPPCSRAESDCQPKFVTHTQEGPIFLPAPHPRLSVISATPHHPSWARSARDYPCLARWGEVDHRALWSPPVLGWGWGWWWGETSARLVLSVRLGRVSWRPVDFPTSHPIWHTKGHLDTCSHHLWFSGMTYSLLCLGMPHLGKMSNHQPSPRKEFSLLGNFMPDTVLSV